ncbi:MAG TPA: polyprenyl diphosphate synthase [Steroidobacteraceae bacterium]
MADSPQHVAIIMDGNGRWARSRGMPRVAGHRASVKVVRKLIEECAARGVQYLTLFAFSSENWRRPADEVGVLMGLFLDALVREVADLHRNGVRLRFIGDREQLGQELKTRMRDAESLTARNSGLGMMVAVAYGGRWDISQACRSLAADVAAGKLAASDISEEHIAARLALRDVPDPDLLIRTGGEQRISNFLLWNLAYTELYFTEVLWPEFSAAHLQAAFEHYAQRERRFGMTSAQLNA